MSRPELFGLPEDVVESIRAVLRAHPAVEQAVIYGSRAKGNFKPGSDIDLTLKGAGLGLTEQLQIESELDELMLPYKIDLSLFLQIDNKELLDHIQRVGRKFY